MVVDLYLAPDAFSRMDESDDALFYATDRFVSHLDSVALSTIEDLIGRLVTGEKAVILDLMASWDSHIPSTVQTSKVVGLGLNERELSQNRTLTEYVIHDLNKEPELPFADDTFDAVICTVSVDYMTRPVEVFREVGRILKPRGLFLVIFSNRMFPLKAIKIWYESDEEERVFLVKGFFERSRMFDEPRVFSSKGKSRPEDDKYAYLGIPSDPVYAVYAYKREGEDKMESAGKILQTGRVLSREEVEKRKKEIKNTLCCPYCGEKLKKWKVPQTIFTQWPNEYLYLCFNDGCPYFIRGWDTMAAQGNTCSYRLMYDPLTDSCNPMPVLNRNTLKSDVIEDE